MNGRRVMLQAIGRPTDFVGRSWRVPSRGEINYPYASLTGGITIVEADGRFKDCSLRSPL